MINPFSESQLNKIFKINPKVPGTILTRESKTLEFKESFSIDTLNKCMRTIAGFANSEGGYIVFGIKDTPHELKGLDSKNENRFDSVDSALLTERLNSHFDPEIYIELYKHKFEGKFFGLLYVLAATHRPVICKKNEGTLRESAIYFRYRGLTREIKYSELRSILSEEIGKENKKWMKILQQLGESGVSNTAILNLQNGKISSEGQTFVIDESLLKQIKFIKEGSFIETGGDPTLKVIGEIETLEVAKTIVVGRTQPRAITIDDIYTNFIKQEVLESPQEFIKQICYQTSGNLPIYYFIQQARLSINEAVAFIDEIPNESPPKNLLRRRLVNQETSYAPFTNFSTPVGRKKIEFKDAILSRRLVVPPDCKELKHCLSAIQSLSKQEVQAINDYLFDLFFIIYTNYYYGKECSNIRSQFRHSICWVDEALFMPKL